MKEKIGRQNVLYPTPVTVVAALVEGKVNFINICHVGIINASPPHLISLSMSKAHHTNAGIREEKAFSVNLMTKDELVKADYVGLVSGRRTDKSTVFKTFFGELGNAPIIEECPLSMECRLFDTYEIKTHDIFIGEIVATWAEGSVVTEGKVDIAKVHPLLFDMSSREYWSLGESVGHCWKDGRSYED